MKKILVLVAMLGLDADPTKAEALLGAPTKKSISGYEFLKQQKYQEARAAFLAAGGKEFGYIPCLNDQHEGIAALAAIAIEHMAGWPTGTTPDAAELERSKERARASGASA